MNYNKIIEPFTAAVCLTKGVPMPDKPVLLDEKARRFLAEMVMSEMIEYVLATEEVDKIDALVDAIIYITDTCLRHGISLHVHKTPVYDPDALDYAVWWRVKDFVKTKTEATQYQELSRMLQRLSRGHDFDLLPFIEEVAKANERKINPNGTVTLNEKGKVMKPVGFVAPDLSKILLEVKNG